MRFVLWFGIFLFLSEPAFAWGPAMHLHLAHRMLELGVATGGLVNFVHRYPKYFYYGNVIADIIIGKNMIDRDEHCHNWSVARNLRKEAETPQAQAFAVGYWTHLAADTVAHNLFLSEERTPTIVTGRKVRHVYLEFQADAWVPEHIREELKVLVQMDVNNERRLLETVIPRTLLPFEINWFLMGNYLKLSGSQSTKKVAEFMSLLRYSELENEKMEFYSDLSLDRMSESLHGEYNRITGINPISGGKRFVHS